MRRLVGRAGPPLLGAALAWALGASPAIGAPAAQGAVCSSGAGRPSQLAQATYYHPSLQSQVMANGNLYDAHNPLQAASNRFRLGTVLRVRRADGYGELLVEVMDRGSAAVDLDLSEAAFARLGSLEQGRVAVCVEAIN